MSFRAPSTLCLAALALVACSGNSESPHDATPRARESAPLAAAPPGMVWIPGGEFTMGSSDGLPDERPPHRVRVSGFFLDVAEVTNAQFRTFVDATGYVTTAERPIDVDELMRQAGLGAERPAPELLVPGALVLDATQSTGWWWKWQPGASWRKPDGVAALSAEHDLHPVVQVAWDDAVAYCEWAGKRLPTEAEWEFAARGGLDGARHVWGRDKNPGGAHMANIWQGRFPEQNLVEDGFAGTAPVKSFPANGYGLFDMSGNVWEWVSDWYRRDTYAKRADVTVDPLGPDSSYDPQEPNAPKRVNRGGSFLCSDNYCIGYRPSARMKSSPDTGLFHTGFRCAVTEAMLANGAKR
jgi:sulfatase modifying factor 1